MEAFCWQADEQGISVRRERSGLRGDRRSGARDTGGIAASAWWPMKVRASSWPGGPVTVRGVAVPTVARAALAVTASLAGSGCATATQVGCAGQCGPPYELQVFFKAGTSRQAADSVLTRCGGNRVVIRVGKLLPLGQGQSTAMVYTRVLGYSARTSALLKCLRSSGVASAGWPD